MKWAMFWGGAIGSLIGLDIALNRRRNGSTLSEVVRLGVRTTPQGEQLFALAWWGFAFWFWRHIIKGD